jgi:hypothetical protein
MHGLCSDFVSWLWHITIGTPSPQTSEFSQQRCGKPLIPLMVITSGSESLPVVSYSIPIMIESDEAVLMLTPGQAHDLTCVEPLIENVDTVTLSPSSI